MTKPSKHIDLILYAACFTVLIVGVLAMAKWGGEGQSNQPEPTVEEVRDAAPSADVQPEQGQPPAALFGYDPQPEETRKFLRELPKPTIREAGPNLFKARGPPEDVFLYRALYKAHADRFGSQWTVGAQGIGDCVSWGFAHGADIHLAIMWLEGDSAKWMPAATESIYGGSRVEARGVKTGGWSDGSYGSAAAKWLRDYGLIFRDKYDSIDLTTYSARRAKDWGYYGNGGQGDEGTLDEIAREHPVRDVALVSNFDEAAAAIESGYPIPVCSNVGFKGVRSDVPTPRDEDGFAVPRGTWYHCMCFIGVRHGDRPGLLCLNSWGPKAAAGGKYPEDMPEGSFWIDKQTVNRMLAQRDSFAISGYGGFPFKKLDHAGWVLKAAPGKGDSIPYFALAL